MSQRGTVYLDIDGVIFPHSDVAMQTSESYGGLHPQIVSVADREYFYEEVADRIKSLGAHVILASSRGSLDFPYLLLAERMGLSASLVIDSPKNNIRNKSEAVSRHWSGADQPVIRWFDDALTEAVGPRAVWIDDAASDDATIHPSVRNNQNILIIAPDPSIGLTLEHLNHADEFLSGSAS